MHIIYSANVGFVVQLKVQKMVDEADKDGTGLLTEKEFMQSGATEVKKNN